MENPNTQRRAIGLLVIFATILALMGMWNLPGTEYRATHDSRLD
jgi:hypothetical protein